jgi:hypothetical protein
MLGIAAAIHLTPGQAQSTQGSSFERLAGLDAEFRSRDTLLATAQKELGTVMNDMKKFDEAILAARKTHGAALNATGAMRDSQLRMLEDWANELGDRSRDAFAAQERAFRSLEALETHASRLHFRTSELTNELQVSGSTSSALEPLGGRLRTETHSYASRATQALAGMKDILNASLAGTAALGPLGERTTAESARLRGAPPGNARAANAPAARAFAQSLTAANTRLLRLRESIASLPPRLAADYPASPAIEEPLEALRRALTPKSPGV